jgi:hypothetical protein
MVILEFKWTTSRARDTYGYNVCTLYADGVKVARCNGGGYDMEGTCLGEYVAEAFADRLRAIPLESYPEQFRWEPATQPAWMCYDCHVKILPERVRDRTEGAPLCPKCGAAGQPSQHSGERVSIGRRLYGLTFYADGKGTNQPENPAATPVVNGGCGWDSIEDILKAIGLRLHTGRSTSKLSVYVLKEAN